MTFWCTIYSHRKPLSMRFFLTCILVVGGSSLTCNVSNLTTSLSKLSYNPFTQYPPVKAPGVDVGRSRPRGRGADNHVTR